MILLACTSLVLLGLAYALTAYNQRRDRAQRRQQLLDRLERCGKVTRW